MPSSPGSSATPRHLRCRLPGFPASSNLALIAQCPLATQTCVTQPMVARSGAINWLAADRQHAIPRRAPCPEPANLEGSPRPVGPGSKSRATRRRFIRRHAASWRPAASAFLSMVAPLRSSTAILHHAIEIEQCMHQLGNLASRSVFSRNFPLACMTRRRLSLCCAKNTHPS